MENLYLPEGQLSNRETVKFYTESIEKLHIAKDKGIILEGIAVLCDNSHNLYVDLGVYRAFMPREEVVFGEVKDIAIITRVGKPVCFVITDIVEKDGSVSIFISRRLAQKACYENYISGFNCGDVIDAKVTHLEHFGAFCDIGCGVISLLPVDCISVSRLYHPSERFCAGQFIRAIIKDKDEALGRVTLSHKELLGTWLENAELFTAGQTVPGIVRSVEDYGIFIELTPNLAGLAEWCSDIEEGQVVAVYIKSIIPEKMKIKLAIVDISTQVEFRHDTQYFFDGGHMDYWVYSPEGASKQIATEFM